MPISSTTMHIEAHWKHLKTSCLYDFKRPRRDFLLVLLCDKHYLAMLDEWNRILSGLQPHRHNRSLEKVWKWKALKVREETADQRRRHYLTDPEK
jgi:hypothetical protein